MPMPEDPHPLPGESAEDFNKRCEEFHRLTLHTYTLVLVLVVVVLLMSLLGGVL